MNLISETFTVFPIISPYFLKQGKTGIGVQSVETILQVWRLAWEIEHWFMKREYNMDGGTVACWGAEKEQAQWMGVGMATGNSFILQWVIIFVFVFAGWYVSILQKTKCIFTKNNLAWKSFWPVLARRLGKGQEQSSVDPWRNHKYHRHIINENKTTHYGV